MANIKEQAAAVNMLSNARLTAAQVINSVFSDGAYANIALGKALKANEIIANRTEGSLPSWFTAR